MEKNREEISKEMIRAKEGHLDKATSTTENNLLLDVISPNFVSSEKLVDTVDSSDEHVLFKRKANLNDKVHGKKHKVCTVTRERLPMEESGTEGSPSTHVSRENFLEDRRPTNLNFKQINTESGFLITFSDELSAENAIRLSGYKVKIHNKDEASYNGVFSVEYAEPGLNQDCFNSAEDSKDPDIDNSDYEFNTLLQKIKNENTFRDALSDVIGLLKQKKISKKNAIALFPLMQNIYCHVLYLVAEKGNFELDVSKSKCAAVKQIEKTCELLKDIYLAFKLSLEINNKSCFTKQQRENVEIWKNHCSEYITLYMEEVSFYETSLDEQNNQPIENIELHQENKFPECDLEDSERCNQEHQNQKDHYSSPRASLPTCYHEELLFINDKLSKEETFLQAANTLIKWLENDICSAENARSFYTMIQCIHNHVIKLFYKNDKCEETLENGKGRLINHYEEILHCLLKVERIYLTVTLERCFNYFTLAERRNIELWMNFANKFKLNIKKDVHKLKMEAKGNRSKRNTQFCKQLNDSIRKLEEDHRSLQRQFKDVQSNITSLKCTFKNDMKRLDNEIASLNKAVTKSQRVVLILRERCLTTQVELRELRSSIYQQNIENELPDSPVIMQDMARVISLICIFLCSSPGASIDSIHSYLHGIDATIDCIIIENVLRGFSSMFQERIIGTGANLLKKWFYVPV